MFKVDNNLGENILSLPLLLSLLFPFYSFGCYTLKVNHERVEYRTLNDIYCLLQLCFRHCSKYYRHINSFDLLNKHMNS